MYPPHLQSEFIGQESLSHLSLPEEPEAFLGHYVDDLEALCPTSHLDIQEAILMLRDLPSGQVSRSQAAALRYIEQVLISHIPLPF